MAYSSFSESFPETCFPKNGFLHLPDFSTSRGTCRIFVVIQCSTHLPPQHHFYTHKQRQPHINKDASYHTNYAIAACPAIHQLSLSPIWQDLPLPPRQARMVCLLH